jgi:hypothetical protein
MNGYWILSNAFLVLIATIFSTFDCCNGLQWLIFKGWTRLTCLWWIPFAHDIQFLLYILGLTWRYFVDNFYIIFMR